MFRFVSGIFVIVAFPLVSLDRILSGGASVLSIFRAHASPVSMKPLHLQSEARVVGHFFVLWIDVI